VIELNGPGFGRLRLTLPETTEGQRFHVPDVRVGAKLVGSLAYEKPGHGALIAAPYQLAGMAADAPELFSSVRGGWVGRGRARAFLAKLTPHKLEGAWPTAWPNRAPKGLSPARAGSR
jgi:hypothetical protein